jgi:hypothetical protein
VQRFDGLARFEDLPLDGNDRDFRADEREVAFVFVSDGDQNGDNARDENGDEAPAQRAGDEHAATAAAARLDGR